MLHVYINYPDPKISVHRDSACGAIRSHGKKDQRIVPISSATMTDVMARFQRKEYAFAANPAGNDMWLEIDLGDAELEMAALRRIHGLIARHYSRFARVEIAEHC